MISKPEQMLPQTLKKKLIEVPFVRVLIRGAMIAGFLGSIASVLGFMGISLRPYSLTLIASVLIWLLLWLIVEFLILWYDLHTNKHIHYPAFDLASTTLLEAELDYSQGRTSRILRLRESLSRSFWVEGRLQQRIRLGELADQAALAENDVNSRLPALIDDLGWTLVALRQHDKAKQYINHGLQLATKQGKQYWIAKAHRHLGGILTIQRQVSEARTELTLAANYAQSISPVELQNEMIAGIEYGLAVLCLLEDNLQEAEEHATKSDHLRAGGKDITRLIRTHALKGKIALAKGDLVAAKDHFSKGLIESVRAGRTDEMIRNHLGLMEFYKRQNAFVDAEHHRDEARRLWTITPVPYELDEDRTLVV